MYFLLTASQLLSWMEQFAYQYGYLGVFLVSLIGALSIIFPVPYTIVIYLLGTVLDPFLMAVAGGLGSALGEISGYILGYYGRAIISKERQRKIHFMLEIFDRYGSITIFLFALTPLPDDLLFIPLGIMQYHFMKAFIPCLLGKMFMSFTLATAGRLSINVVGDVFGESGWWTAIISTAILMVIVAAMLKVDWEKLFTQYIEKSGNKRKE